MPKDHPITTDADEFIDENGRPNKSALKRRAQGLQDLGEVLIGLPQTELDALPLPEVLRDAVMLARRITQHGGLYRQKQLIGKLMRKIDAEPIRIAVEARQARDRATTRQFQLIERWRGRLIQEKDAIAEFVRSYPTADRAQLQRLVDQARHERDNERPPKAARELFTVVQSLIKPATIPP